MNAEKIIKPDRILSKDEKKIIKEFAGKDIKISSVLTDTSWNWIMKIIKKIEIIKTTDRGYYRIQIQKCTCYIEHSETGFRKGGLSVSGYGANRLESTIDAILKFIDLHNSKNQTTT